LQGLPVGWGDTYTSGLAGQSIDITGLPDGIYWLRSTADFEDRIDERRDNNNSAKVKIQITRTTVTQIR
jgi:Lysyl oxidase